VLTVNIVTRMVVLSNNRWCVPISDQRNICR
jgi:hypothetical protein